MDCEKGIKELSYQLLFFFDRLNVILFKAVIACDQSKITSVRSNPTEEFFAKGVLKICSNFPGEHPCRSVISVKLFCNFIEITLRHECSSVNLLHIFRTRFPQNTSGGLLLRNSVNQITKLSEHNFK